MNYRLHPAAEAEHLEQIAFYQSQQQGLGSRYREHFLQAMQKICETPTRYPIDRPPDIRRIQLRTFPLTIIYRERNATVQVLAVAHYRKRPRYWLGRLT
jgi:plasmid stabilization system protein ParE